MPADSADAADGSDDPRNYPEYAHDANTDKDGHSHSEANGQFVSKGGGEAGAQANESGNPEENTGRSRKSAHVVELKGDELGVKNGETIQDAAHRYYETLRSNPANREGFGSVAFTRVGRNKLDSASLPDPERLKLLPAVKPLIEHGDYIGRAEVKEKRKDGIVAYHYFEGNVKIGGATKFAGVSVGEDAFKHKFYNLTEDPDVLLEAKKRKALGSSEEKVLSPTPSAARGTTDEKDRSRVPKPEVVGHGIDSTTAENIDQAEQGNWVINMSVGTDDGIASAAAMDESARIKDVNDYIEVKDNPLSKVPA
jgi:hypothetical protein